MIYILNQKGITKFEATCAGCAFPNSPPVEGLDPNPPNPEETCVAVAVPNPPPPLPKRLPLAELVEEPNRPPEPELVPKPVCCYTEIYG